MLVANNDTLCHQLALIQMGAGGFKKMVIKDQSAHNISCSQRCRKAGVERKVLSRVSRYEGGRSVIWSMLINEGKYEESGRRYSYPLPHVECSSSESKRPELSAIESIF